MMEDVDCYVAALLNSIAANPELRLDRDRTKICLAANDFLPEEVPKPSKRKWRGWRSSVPEIKNVFESDISDIGRRMSLLEKECEAAGISVSDVNHYWYKSELFSIHAHNDGPSLDEVLAQFVDQVRTHAPKYKTFKRKKPQNARLLVVNPADVHYDKLAILNALGVDTYSIDIARQRIIKGTQHALHETAGMTFDKIIFVLGNDFFNSEGSTGMTSAGTPQRNSAPWYQSLMHAHQTVVECIDMLLQFADVHIMHVSGNHDRDKGAMFSTLVAEHYWNCDNVQSTIVPDEPYQYIEYGKNLIGFTHGDFAKANVLPDQMKSDARHEWARCWFAYWLTHHYHQEKSDLFIAKKKKPVVQDFGGIVMLDTSIEQRTSDVVKIETLPSLGETDLWHRQMGFGLNTPRMKSFVFDPTMGNVAAFQIPF